MDVDVTYEGLILMRGATLTTTPNGPFIGLSAPMPVGTNLVLQREGASCTVRVARVEEGTSAGIFIAPLESLDRLMPGAAVEIAPPTSPPESLELTVAAAEEAPAAPAVAAEPAEVPQVSATTDASAPEAMESPQDAARPPETAAPGDEVKAASAAEATATAEASPESVPSTAASETVPASETEAAPPEAPAIDAPTATEATSGGVAQEMDPRIVTAPVVAADILEEMPAGNTGPVQAPKKSQGAQGSDGDASKKGRSRAKPRGSKKR